MTSEESVPEPYLPLWQVAVLMLVTCFLTALGAFFYRNRANL